jgi:tRNA(Ile)-lysidine synthase
VILDVQQLNALPTAARRRVLRAAAAQVKGTTQGRDLSHIQRLLDLAGGTPASGRATLPGLDACRSFGWLRLSSPGRRQLPFRLTLPVPGEVRLPGVRLRTQLQPAPVDSRYNVEGEALDWDRVPGTLELRSWLPGDTFRPCGESQEHKIKDLFQRARIPSWERCEWPILGKDRLVLWVKGFGPAEGFAPTFGTRTILRVFAGVEDSEAV